MDFSTFSLEEMAAKGAVYELKDAIDNEPMMDKNGKPVTFTILGKDSKQFRKAVVRIAARMQSDQAGRKKSKKMSEAEIMKSIEDGDTNGAETIAAIVTDSSGVEWGGKPVGGDKKMLVELFTQHPWIVKQLDEFINDRQDFFKNAKMG